MSTNIRAELSKKNEYWIDRHRYYELKHFVMQYPLWKEHYDILDGIKSSSVIVLGEPRVHTSHVEEDAIRKIFYTDRMNMVKKAAQDADPVIGSYILKGILQGFSYDKLSARYKVPCSRDEYYKLYRRFFWLLSKLRK